MTNPDPSIAWNVILTIGVLVAIGANIIALFRSNRAQKRDVTIMESVVTRNEFDKHVASNHQDHRDMFSKLGGVERGSAGKLSEEITKVHNRINDLDKSVGGLEATTELQNQTLSSINSDVKRILERMPRTHP